MRNEDDKSKDELDKFAEFIEVSGIHVNEDSVRKGDDIKKEPDIYCEMEEGVVYFELTEACAPELASAINRAIKSAQDEVLWCRDVTTETLRKKLNKSYDVTKPIELIIYTKGRTALPDDVLVPQLKPLLTNGLGSFRRVWLFGDEVHCLASNR